MTAKYSFHWAESVVGKLHEKYSRATELFLRISGLSMRQLARLLAEDRPEWKIIRDSIKILDKWLERWPAALTTTQTLSDILVNPQRKMPIDYREYLTGRINLLYLGSSQKRGEGDRGEAEEALPATFQAEGGGDGIQ